jgi:1-acyl-sn-glycerol-3-phosphate acyltransferase
VLDVLRAGGAELGSVPDGPDGLIKKPGRVVLEFLEPIPAGLRRAEFMHMLEERIETATNRLVTEGRQT